MREYSGIFLAVPFLLLIVCSLILTSPLSATGQEGRDNGNFITIDKTNNTLANLTAEAQISPYSSFVLLAYCPPGSLDIAECKTLIFPVLTEQPEIIR
ncbi:MAG: hypothetical protein M3297_16360 [Thermoproteota archaeon]|nr:hypothetical protein [Thermoproteota archaeon]